MILLGQAEIIEALEKLNKPCSRGEIAAIMGLDPIRVSHLLATLVKHEEVEVQIIDRHEASKYHCKRSIRLYQIKTSEV